MQHGQVQQLAHEQVDVVAGVAALPAGTHTDWQLLLALAASPTSADR